MGSGPLDHPRLLEIEERLDRAEIDTAQRLLAELGDLNVHRVAITYFATRLLYQRGRLDAAGVVDRLRELVSLEPNFPQASAMLSAAEKGTLRPDREGFLRATSDPLSLAESSARAADSRHSAPTRPAPGPQSKPEDAPLLTLDSDDVQEIDTEHDQLAIDAGLTPPVAPVWAKPQPVRSTSMPEIPRAPILPHFTVPENATPSYAPGARTPSLQFELELEVPEALRDTIREPEPEPLPSSVSSARSAQSADSAKSAPSSEPPDTVPDPASVPPDALQRGPGPESMLEGARVAWDQGEHERALADVERLEHAPLLDPELRVDCARFLIEAGEPERAAVQARKAHQDDPGSALVQLILAWALIRSARRSPNPQSIEEAESVLRHLRTKSGPIPALAQALRAAILAEKGEAERAITTAQLALKLDPTAADAEAAISLACARLGRLDDAQAAWERLYELSAEEAACLCDRLQQLGLTLRGASALPARNSSSAIRLWDTIEVELFYGDRARAIAAFERGAARELQGLVGESATDAIPLLATMAAAFFTTEPVWRHFAPFDLSLGSIARVEAVLDVLYGRAPRDSLSPEAYHAQVMLASYVGECLRQGYGGHWIGSLASPETVFVDASHTRFAPFHELRLRLEQGKPLLFEGAEGRNTRQSGAPIISPVTPPTPWDPAQWPSPRMLPRLGLAFSRSVVELYCAEFGGGPLDRSPVGLHSLDNYVALLAPRSARPAGGARWVERSSVLIGAYLGEVLRDAVGASWRDLLGAPIGPESYTLLLPDGNATHPVTMAYDRLSGRTSDLLSHYAARLIDELS